MEDELWKQLYRMVMAMASHQYPRCATYSDAEIVLTFLWSVLNDRPAYWACQKRNWPIWHRRTPLPDDSTLSRRLRSPSVRQLMASLETQLIRLRPASACRWIDAKPLPIGGNSQDGDAGYGRAAGCKARGYKLHAVGDESQQHGAEHVGRASGFSRRAGQIAKRRVIRTVNLRVPVDNVERFRHECCPSRSPATRPA